MSLGLNIRLARTRARLSQEELARRAGLNRTYLSQVENGHSDPTTSVVARLAEALGVSLADLLPGPPPDPEPASRFTTDPDECIYPGLLDFLADERARLLMNPTAEEIGILKSIRFQDRFQPSRQFFIDALFDIRRHRHSE